MSSVPISILRTKAITTFLITLGWSELGKMEWTSISNARAISPNIKYVEETTEWTSGVIVCLSSSIFSPWTSEQMYLVVWSILHSFSWVSYGIWSEILGNYFCKGLSTSLWCQSFKSDYGSSKKVGVHSQQWRWPVKPKEQRHHKGKEEEGEIILIVIVMIWVMAGIFMGNDDLEIQT